MKGERCLVGNMGGKRGMVAGGWQLVNGESRRWGVKEKQEEKTEKNKAAKKRKKKKDK